MVPTFTAAKYCDFDKEPRPDVDHFCTIHGVKLNVPKVDPTCECGRAWASTDNFCGNCGAKHS